MARTRRTTAAGMTPDAARLDARSDSALERWTPGKDAR